MAGHSSGGSAGDVRRAGAGEQTHLLRSILQNIAEGVCVADTSGRLLLFNAAAQRIVGMPLTDVPFAAWPERYGCYLPDGTTPYPAEQLPLARASRGEEVDRAQLFLRNAGRPEGAWLSVNARPILDDRGAVWGGVTVFRDITERKRQEGHLRRAHRALRAISSCDQALIRAADEPALLREVCRVIVQVAGYRLCWVGYAERDEGRAVRPVAQAGYEEGYLRTVNVTWADAERGRGPVGTAIRTRAPSVFQDVAADPRFAPWREEAAKRGYASVLGLPLLAGAAVLGALAIYASEPDAFDEEEVALLRALADDLAYGIIALRTRAERARAEEALRQAHDELERRVAERTDELTRANARLRQEVAERKRAEQELHQAKEAAEAANRAKSAFLAAMSHEIRTPMNAVLGMTELALETDLTPQQREYLGLARQSAEALLTVINDILDFSKVEAGKLDLDLAPFGLRACVGDTLSALAPRAHRKGLELACAIAADVPDGLVGDAGRLRQVLVNLVGNGIKFADEGEVVVSISREATGGTESPGARPEARSSSVPPASSMVCLRFEARDTGIGIPADKQRLIFAPFSQVDACLRRRYDGTGLGLAISRRLVELMGGEIAFESEAGRGSTFHFTASFGLAPSPPERPGGEVPAVLRGLRVLVVDDNATNRRILTDLLSAWGMSPAGADGGRSALAALGRAAEAGRPFGLVVADAEMPDVNGLALAERLRQEPGWGAAVIMMLGSVGLPSASARCREVGVAGCLTKPVRQAELWRAVLGALGIADAGERPADAPGRPGGLPQRPLRVLVAEDNPVNQKLAVTLLEKQGHTVVVAGAGAEVLAALQQQPFDLVLMDVQMPGMDGLEATAHIRRREAATGTHVPVVAMTAYAMKGDRERCLEAGMDDYVSKPVRAQELYNAISRAVRPRTEAVAVAAGDERPLPAGPIDWVSAREHVGGDEQLLRELARLFLTEHSRWLAELRQAQASADAAALQGAAHRLKGALGTLGARAAFDEALRVETLGRQGSLADADGACALLETELERLRPELTAFVQGA